MRPAPVEAVPGDFSYAFVEMPEIEVELEDEDQGITVQAVHAADDGCPAGASYNLGVTDSDGFLGAALPYGTWDIYVDGDFAETVVLDPNDPYNTANIYVDLS